MSERLKYMGRLEERRLDAERLKLRMAGLRDSIRDILDPFEPLDAVNFEIAAAQSMELAALQITLKEAQAEMALIRKVLGREG